MSTVILKLTCAIAFGCKERGSELTNMLIQSSFSVCHSTLTTSYRGAVDTKGEDIRLYDIENNEARVLEVSFFASLEGSRAVLPVDALEAAVLVRIMIYVAKLYRSPLN